MTGSMTVLYFVINPGFLWISLIYSWESAFQSFPTKKKEKNVISFQSKFSKIQVGFDSDWRMCCGDFDLFFQWSNCPKLHEVEYLWNKIPLCDHFLQDLQHIQSESNTIHPQRSSIFRSIVTKVWILNLERESVCVCFEFICDSHVRVGEYHQQNEQEKQVERVPLSPNCCCSQSEVV